MKGIITQECVPEILVEALDFVSQPFLELETFEIVASRVLQEAACPAAAACDLTTLTISMDSERWRDVT
jgi:hypothetical protein